MTLDPRLVKNFQGKILTWFAQHQRDLPWRKTRSPYAILVSEVMLQQTQVPRVIPKYQPWLTTFPNFEALANAKTSGVLALWSGLGYNRRAINVQRLAQVVTEQYRGQLPNDVEKLRKLPGIGEYTARAVACFAFDQQVAVVDTNIRKVIAIEFFDGHPPNTKTIQQIADQLLPNGKAYLWNQALMDYVSAMLSKEKIPIPRQTKFIGSNRWYRGQIIKLLIKDELTTTTRLAQQFTEVDKLFLTKVIAELVRDKLVVEHDGTITLPT